MRFRPLQLIAVCFFCVASTPSQTPEASPVTRSHVERFSTPAARSGRAEAEATAQLSANPNNTEALNARAYARMGLGRYQEAAEDLTRAISLKPDAADYHANLGYALWKLGRRADAVNAERTALKYDEKNFTAHYQLGRFLLLGGNPKDLAEAAAHLRRALEIDPRRSEVRFDLLTAYRTLGDASNAIAQLNLLQDARPADPRVAYAEALLASDRGDMNAAITGFRQTLRLDPTLYGAWQDLGLAFIKLKRWPEAVEAFAELSRHQSDSVEGAYLYALSLFNSGSTAQAEREARRALRLDAGAAAAHTLLGIILSSRGGANQEASEALMQAISLDPGSFDAHFYLGRVQYALSDFSGAAKSLGTAVKLDPRHPEARFFLGTVLEALSEGEAAFLQYQELVKLDPQSPIGLVGLGAMLVKQGKIDEAISALRKSIALDPKSFEAHLTLGRALALAERFAEAIESLTVAVSVSPDRASAHYQLGQALRRAGRSAEATREFAIVERLNAEFRIRTAAPQ